MENSLFPILSTAAFALLILVTLGVAIITVTGWRDRQRREQDKRVGR